MKGVELSGAAELDLEKIGDYISQDNPRRAESFLGEIRQRCLRIGEFPEAAPMAQGLMADIRAIPFKGYVIFYRNDRDEIVVLRVLHGSRDIKSILGDIREGF